MCFAEPSRLTQQLHVLQGAEDHTREVGSQGDTTANKWVGTDAPTNLNSVQAFATWHSLIGKYRGQALTPVAVCAAVEDAAVALPDLASGAPAWPLVDDLEEAADGQGALSRPLVMHACMHLHIPGSAGSSIVCAPWHTCTGTQTSKCFIVLAWCTCLCKGMHVQGHVSC